MVVCTVMVGTHVHRGEWREVKEDFLRTPEGGEPGQVRSVSRYLAEHPQEHGLLSTGGFWSKYPCGWLLQGWPWSVLPRERLQQACPEDEIRPWQL